MSDFCVISCADIFEKNCVLFHSKREEKQIEVTVLCLSRLQPSQMYIKYFPISNLKIHLRLGCYTFSLFQMFINYCCFLQKSNKSIPQARNWGSKYSFFWYKYLLSFSPEWHCTITRFALVQWYELGQISLIISKFKWNEVASVQAVVMQSQMIGFHLKLCALQCVRTLDMAFQMFAHKIIHLILQRTVILGQIIRSILQQCIMCSLGPTNQAGAF